MSSVDLFNGRPRARWPRVLLVGRDRKYLAEASEGLRARGFEVATTCRPSEIVDLIRRLDLNVAVVDGSHYLAGVIRGMAAVETITSLAVVTVAEDSLISPLSRPDVLPKWRSLARLADLVEVAFELHATPSPEASVAVA